MYTCMCHVYWYFMDSSPLHNYRKSMNCIIYFFLQSWSARLCRWSKYVLKDIWRRGMNAVLWPSLFVGSSLIHSSGADDENLVFSPEFCSIYIVYRYASSNRDGRKESGESITVFLFFFLFFINIFACSLSHSSISQAATADLALGLRTITE